MISNTKNEISYGFKNLIAWQKADLLAKNAYKITLKFPRDETFGVTSQLRRAVLSISLNIVEGYARNGKKEFHHFLSITLGSLAEVEYLLMFSLDQKYLSTQEFDELIKLKEEVGQLVWKLYKSQV